MAFIITMLVRVYSVEIPINMKDYLKTQHDFSSRLFPEMLDVN